METIDKFNQLKQYFDKANVIDVKVFKGKVTLREMIAAMLSYSPWWLVLLYRVRKLLVSLLGLVKHQVPEKLPHLKPEDVPFTPGAWASFFTVRSAQEGTYWMSETPEDKHLRAYFGIVREPLRSGMNRFYVITTVYYKHWTGPVYFNLIRPFHHIVVRRMAQYGVKG